MTAISGRQDGSGLSKPLGLTLLIATVGALISLSAMFATGATASLSEQDFPEPMAGAVGNANYSPETRANTELGKARRAKSKKYTQVAAGGAHSCGLEKSGQVRCWGSKKWLQTGDPKSGYVTKKPIKVSGLPKVRVMSAGFRHSCALTKNDRAFCWGENSSGELGAGSSSSSGCDVDTGCSSGKSKAVAVVDLANPTAIAAGSSFSCAVARGQAVYCWGRNNMGQLGDGTTTSRFGPVATPISSGASQLALGDEHACALLGNGEVRCWGANSYGQLGSGAKSLSSSVPVEVSLPAAATSITAGLRHTCAQLANGQVFCWGDNRVGQLGDGSKTARATPSKIAVSGVRQISAGGRNTCMITKPKKLKCWGDNGVGQLGLGNTKKVSGKKTVKKLDSVTDVSISYSHSCAVSKGGARCWGNNSVYQLGDRTNTNRDVPVKVK